MLNLLKNIAHLGLLDYQTVMAALEKYKAPHRKLDTMLAKGELIRIKKGLYYLAKPYYSGLINPMVAAQMDKLIINMMEQYNCSTTVDYENALKQIMQHVALLGLWRSKFFEHGCFLWRDRITEIIWIRQI